MPTPKLFFPYIETQQAQKEVTHAESLNKLDALVQAAVESRVLVSPPVSPLDGALYIVAASATGTWAGQNAKLAHFIGGVWKFYTPNEGWRVWVKAENVWVVYQGSTWRLPTPMLPSYTVATLPIANIAAQIIYVSNESGGAVLAFSDGANWRRVTDRVVVS